VAAAGLDISSMTSRVVEIDGVPDLPFAGRYTQGTTKHSEKMGELNLLLY
jgi:hypothetical protein